MDKWLKAALDYIPSWLEFQMRMSKQPGCVVAITHRGRVVLEQGFGQADLTTQAKLTPRHRFRIASHSKSFTAAGIMKLREQRKLKLDDTAGTYVEGLDPKIARATIGQLLSHSAGIVRDGTDSGYFVDRRPFPSQEQLRVDLKPPPSVEPNTRFKYSNHGFSILGMVISSITSEPYARWIKREVIDAAGLEETEPDMPLPARTPFARGHSGELPLGRRIVIPGDFQTHAIGPAGGIVSTARDVARFFDQLSPNSKRSLLSVDSRREMTRRHWRNPHSSLEQYYGLGIMSGTLRGWDWFGHGGGLQGYISRTATLMDHGLTVSILTNAIDGWAGPWVDGAIHILRTFEGSGAPSRKVGDWAGRWWIMWGAIDLVPAGSRVIVSVPAAWNPFLDASELQITGRDDGRIMLAGGYGSHGEPIRRVRGKAGQVDELWLGSTKLLPEAKVVAEMQNRYGLTSAESGNSGTGSRARNQRSKTTGLSHR